MSRIPIETTKAWGDRIRRVQAAIERCPKCGAGPLGNCGYYGCETPRDACPLRKSS